MKRHLLIFLILLAAGMAIAQSHVSDLVVSPTFGSGKIKWYDAYTGGTQYSDPSNTVLVTGTTYYASQTINGVESIARLVVSATANLQPQGSLTANGSFCTDGTGQLTWTATAGTGPYTVRYNDQYGDRTATGVVSGTPFSVVRSISVAEGPQYYTLTSVQDANCTRISGFTGGSATILAGFPPTLEGASQAATVCGGIAATINLSGLLDNKTFTVAYKINGVAQAPVTGVTSEGGTNASFTTSALTAANNGQILQITGLTVTNPATGCTATFTQNVTLSVNLTTTAAPVVTSPICVGATSVSGISESGASVTVYVNGSNPITVTATGTAWTATVSALFAGNTITAFAIASGKCISLVSNSVTVAITAVPVVTSPVLVGATSVAGTSTEADGTTIEIFVGAVSQGTTTVSSGAWSKTGLTALTLGQIVIAYATAAAKCASAISNSLTVSVLAVGDTYQGGKVAYLFASGDPGYVSGETHGLIAAINDNARTTWGCTGTLTSATATALGTGNQNTILVKNACATAGIAARLCSNLGVGWYLPSKDELYKLYLNRVAIGNFNTTITGLYWSSSEDPLSGDHWNSFFYDFSNGGFQAKAKDESYLSRAIRSF